MPRRALADLPADLQEAHGHFWSLADLLLDRPGITRGTMMGFPCLRFEGDYFASIERDGDGMVVKIPAERVALLVEDGQGEHFAPAGRIFKEWVRIPHALAHTWEERLHEAFAFVARS